MKFRNKCWVLYLGQDKDWTQVQIGKEVVGEQPCREGCGVQAAQCESAVTLAAWQANSIPGCIKHSTASAREVITAVFNIGAASSGVLSAVLGPVI